MSSKISTFRLGKEVEELWTKIVYKHLAWSFVNITLKQISYPVCSENLDNSLRRGTVCRLEADQSQA
ncbi:hypothetical protein TNCV_931821 [Trichonephila clavipes]|nr:hypothetical protein TNCV_931821 [Trichonephila clavipes]